MSMNVLRTGMNMYISHIFLYGYVTKIVFLSCPMHSDGGLIVVIVYYFQIWNKKEHNIISSRVISSHMGPMYIETPSISAVWQA